MTIAQPIPKNPRFVDLTGQRFGLITVLHYAGKFPPKKHMWQCLCDCGTETTAQGNHLKSGATKSCGCMKGKTRHRMTKTLTWNRWCGMIERTRNPKYEHHHGKGITVCDRWLVFENFYEDMGDPPTESHSLDRYPDPEGNYEPGNCRWATDREQVLNRTNNIRLTHDGITLCQSEWAERVGIPVSTIRARLAKGWSVADTLTTRPAKRDKRRITFLGKTMSVLQWSKSSGIPYETLLARIKRGWTAEKALTEAIGPNGRKGARLH